MGFERSTYTASTGSQIEVGIWYPSDGQEKSTRLDLFDQDVVSHGPVLGMDLPLIVISHGSGSSNAAHYDTALALAKAGFVVAALTHPGDNYRDSSAALNIAERPPQVRELVDFMLGKWEGRATLSPQRIGAFGFSAGGFAVLALVGGRYDAGLIKLHCDANPSEWMCHRIADGPPIVWPSVPSLSKPEFDPRIKAAVIAAPAIGFAFTKQGLSGVRAPIQLWRAENDEVLPQPFFAQAVYNALPVPPQYIVVPNAGHYDFLAPCTESLKKVAPEICRSAAGFDRAAFHRQFDASIVEFFEANLQVH